MIINFRKITWQFHKPWLAVVLLATATPLVVHAEPPVDVSEFSLEDLADVVITSVSKKEERKNSSAAAIYVLTGEEIRAHGVRNLPEALRLVPGLSVARSDSQNWAVSARGFNSALADKMEVVLDGRSLYTPLFSGVFWDAQGTFIDDIERIEVIRGPGASVWGANAVNGVINIVTKSAKVTQGSMVNLGYGSEDRGFSARHGGTIGQSGSYRAYAQGRDYDASRSLQGGDNQDDWDISQAGFRSDWMLATDTDLTVQGDVYDGDLGAAAGDGSISGFNLLGRWGRQLDATSSLSVHTYFDHIERLYTGQFDEDRDQIDLEVIHNFLLADRHDIVWGVSYRRSSDDIRSFPGSSTSFDPESETLDTFGLFAQDQYALSETTVLTVGTKVEENDYTGTEIQPTLRLAWSPDSLHTWWGSLSRAVRTPNRVDRSINILGFTGSDKFDSEVAVSAETGYRFPFNENTSVDLTAFYTDYSELRAVDVSGAPPFMTDNLGEGSSWGMEASALWIPNNRNRWLFSYRYLNLDLEFPDTTIGGNLYSDPEHEAFIRTTYSLRDNMEVSAMLRYVDELSEGDDVGSMTPSSPVPSYTELNLGLIYRYSPTMEWSLQGENLLHSSHREFGNNAEIERSLHAQLKWRF